jgi:cytochrome c oxidase subunit II
VPTNRTLRRVLTALAAALGAALLAAPAASAGMFAPQHGGSPNADSITTLWWLVVALALIIFLGVEGTLLYSLFKFRARKGSEAAQIHGNTRLEIGWTIGAGVILVFITIFTFIKLPSIKNPPPSLIDANGRPVAASDNVAFAATDSIAPPKGGAMTMKVDGQQYIWRYEYPGADRVFSYVDMYVPVGRTVILDITSDDVNHSWWIPQLGGKFDAIKGYVNKTWFRIPPDAIKPGQTRVVYTGQCAELCGRNHANMYARVIGMRFDDWQRWYQAKRTAIKQAQQAAARQRKRLEAQQGVQAASQGGAGQNSGTGQNP